MSRPAIRLGLTELREPAARPPNRIRRPGGGRKKTVIQDPSLLRDLERLIEPVTRGDPESPLRWTCKSLRKLAAELGSMGHKTSHRMVADLLHDLGYSLQANSKTSEGSSHPDRNAQFEYLNRKVRRQLRHQQPAISVDTKKKELVGDFKNSGRELRPAGHPEQVRVHDFIIPELGRANPYGIYDIAHNTGWVSVGVDHDTADSPWRRSADGGTAWDRTSIPMPPSCLSRRTQAEVMDHASGFGNWSCRNWLIKPG